MAAQGAIHARLSVSLRSQIISVHERALRLHLSQPARWRLVRRRYGDLHGRMAEHDQGLVEGFTKRYGVNLLVYYEFHDNFEEAIRRETQFKKWKRAWKVRLIESMNPDWTNLFDPMSGEIRLGPADVARERPR